MNESIKISGKKIDLLPSKKQWSFELRPGGWVIAQKVEADGKMTRRRICLSELQQVLGISAEGMLWNAQIQHGDHFAQSGSAAAGDLVAQFPGKVRKILVSLGVQVQAGDSLLLIEAMKMEFAIKAPYSGKIKKLHVQEGQPLSPGDVFLDLEADSSSS